MGIQKKLWFGIGGMLFILLLAGVSAAWVIRHSNQALETVFSNNYSSVSYMHELTEALDRMDTQFRIAISKNSIPDMELISKNQVVVAQSVSEEGQRITEQGEQELFNRLNHTWLQLQQTFQRMEDPNVDRLEKRRLYTTLLQPQIRDIKDLAWQISDLNLNSLARFHGKGQQVAETAQRLMALLLLAGVFLGVILVLLVGRSILRPIRLLTHSAREIGRGNLDLTLPETSRDEIGQLASTFNSMAQKLKTYQGGLRAKLLRTQKTTQMAIDSFGDAVAVLGPTGQVELCNHAARQLFGLTLGKTLAGGPLARLEALLPEVLEKGQAYEPRSYNEAFQVFQHGREKFVLPKLMPVKDGKGQVLGITLVLIDVTGLRKMDEMKSSLLATASHELRTPLTSLRMATHLLLEKDLGPLNEKQEDLLVTARDDSERLNEIIEDLLDLGRLESGANLLEFSETSAANLIAAAAAQAEPEYRAKGIYISSQASSALPILKVDILRISYVFQNLLSNALKYSPSGSIVRMGAQKEEAGVRFWVEDEGVGIPQAYRSRIFERFYRVPGLETGSGAGLGLAIAKEIIEMHGGFIEMKERQGGGSIFSFVLLENPTKAPPV